MGRKKKTLNELKASKRRKRLNSNQIARRRRMQDKANGLCCYCHKPLDRKGSYCSKCLEKLSEYRISRREFLLSLGICPVCGVNEILGDETSCPECRAKRYMYSRKSAEKEAEFRKRQRKERAAAGLCTRCGKNKPEPGRRKCAECNKKMRDWKRKQPKKNVRAEWKSQMRCYICGKDELVPGKQVCPDCYRVRLDAIRRCSANRPEGYNQKWRDSNIKIRAKYKVTQTKKDGY